jgi:antitoxin component YwqK of YwqJK toxin-antitoxin module
MHHQRFRAIGYWLLLSSLMGGCQFRHLNTDKELTRVHFVDRNGFKETVSVPDRLAMYANTDFLSPQSYQKVTRTYGCNREGKTVSKITAYHDNGQISDYLELLNGRAYGIYRSWHPNGALAIEAFAIEGIGDLSKQAQVSWVFDGLSRAWNDQGSLLAEIYYEKGDLQGNALYYYPDGSLKRLVPYEKNLIDGDELLYDKTGRVLGTITYLKGQKEGKAIFKGDAEIPSYSEKYQNGLLIEGLYFDFTKQIVSQIENGQGTKTVFQEGKLYEKQEYKNGVQDGMVRRFSRGGFLISTFTIQDGIKEGKEWIYYPPSLGKESQPKLYLEWNRGMVHGICRSWYPNGVLESEREICENQRHGIASGWYADGSIMLIEEYEKDLLHSGTYRKKSEPEVISTVENGKGVATLYDGSGKFLKKVQYDQGKPIPFAP